MSFLLPVGRTGTAFQGSVLHSCTRLVRYGHADVRAAIALALVVPAISLCFPRIPAFPHCRSNRTSHTSTTYGPAKPHGPQISVRLRSRRSAGDLASWEFTTLKHQARRAHKGPRPPVNTAPTKRDASKAISAIDGSNGELAQDLLIGAVAIAKELNWRGPTGGWDVRRVYNIKSRGTLPIHRVRGLGICARRSSLRKFFSALDERAIVPRADSATK